RVGHGLDGGGVVAADGLAQLGHGLLDRRLGVGVDLVGVLLQLLLGAVDQAVGVVAGVDQLAPLLVLGGVGLGVLDHLLDVGVGEAARGLDPDRLLLAGRLVLGLDVDDAVGVDVEGDL